MRHPGSFVFNFIPEMVGLSVGAIYRWVRHAPKTRFVIGSVGPAQVQTRSRRLLELRLVIIAKSRFSLSDNLATFKPYDEICQLSGCAAMCDHEKCGVR